MEPTGHCPFVGLKQNRAIRFSSPTPEHRCYVGGDPIEIPVDQTSYCLSRNHTQCPLYMGLTQVTTPEVPPPVVPVPVPVPAAQTGMRAWLTSLPPRDRVVYLSMIALLVLILGVYIVVGLQSLSGMPIIGSAGTATPAEAPTAVAIQPTATALQHSATRVAATPTNLPTSTPSARPTVEPTKAPIYFPPTATIALPTTTAIPPSQTAQLPTITALPATAIPATAIPATARPNQPVATTRPRATAVPKPTAQPQPTAQAVPTAIPQPEEPAAPLPPTPQPVAPVAEASSEFVWLYFGDSSGTLYVPVQRRVDVLDRQVARAAVLSLIEGPRNGLAPLVSRDANLLGIRIDKGTAFVNFDRDPSGGDSRGYDSLTLTLTHFSSISRVQIQAGGRNIGGPRARPIVNPVNPLGLPADTRQAEFLPLYFVASDGYHHVRIIRIVPKTKQTAEGTVRALLEGPGSYGYALQRVIPAGTDLRGISISDGVVNVDFTQPFAEAGDRGSVVRTITESLTTLPGVRGVRFFVEGTSAADWWGAEYGQVFERPLVNGE